MEEVFKFICDNWSVLLSIFLSVVSIILSSVVLSRTFKRCISDSLNSLLTLIPDLIIEAEQRFEVGSEKLEFVLCYCVRFLCGELKVSESSCLKKYGGMIISFIEKFLETPQKKVR